MKLKRFLSDLTLIHSDTLNNIWRLTTKTPILTLIFFLSFIVVVFNQISGLGLFVVFILLGIYTYCMNVFINPYRLEQRFLQSFKNSLAQSFTSFTALIPMILVILTSIMLIYVFIILVSNNITLEGFEFSPTVYTLLLLMLAILITFATFRLMLIYPTKIDSYSSILQIAKSHLFSTTIKQTLINTTSTFVSIFQLLIFLFPVLIIELLFALSTDATYIDILTDITSSPIYEIVALTYILAISIPLFALHHSRLYLNSKKI